MMKFPGVKDANKGPMGWSRLYGMSSKTKHKAEAWRLLYFMGGKDKAGTYNVAKDWYLKYGVGFPFKSMEQDPDIVAVAEEDRLRPRHPLPPAVNGAGPRKRARRRGTPNGTASRSSRSRTCCCAQIKPADAMAASAKKAQELKKSA